MPSRKDGTNMFNTKKTEMKKAIKEAWSNPTKEQKLFQEKYFPNGKPTVEEFIKTIAHIARQKQSL